MTVLVTGAAGFIGFHVSRALMARGDRVVGVDDVNDYYDPSLKEARLDLLSESSLFALHRADIADREAMAAVIAAHPEIDRVIHLASQAGVRHSLIDPYIYTHSNVEGHLVMMEACRKLSTLKHFVYASSSSVYGANTKMPFSVEDRTDSPLSLYAATKKAMELMAESHARMYAMPLTGLRFFTVYGPWGRPDMSYMIFIRKILAGEAIPVFNNGDMSRDFTYIDDIIACLVACLDGPPADGAHPHRVYNIGNNNSEPLMRFIEVLENALGRKAEYDFLPMQPGDVQATYADIEATRRDFGFAPKTSIEEGLPKLVDWYREFYGD